MKHLKKPFDILCLHLNFFKKYYQATPIEVCTYACHMCISDSNENANKMIFFSQGKIWAKHTSQCILDALSVQEQDLHPKGKCGHVDRRAKAAFMTCAKTHDICNILWSDKEALKRSLHHG